MERVILPESLLKGRSLHCQPVAEGPIIEAPILPSNQDFPTVKVIIACPARRACSKCDLLIKAGSNDNHCLYYKGDSKGIYQIIGPEMYKKSDTGYKNI